jgi:hypothetical protein
MENQPAAAGSRAPLRLAQGNIATPPSKAASKRCDCTLPTDALSHYTARGYLDDKALAQQSHPDALDNLAARSVFATR